MPSCSTLNRYFCQFFAIKENSSLIPPLPLFPKVTQLRIEFCFLVHHKFPMLPRPQGNKTSATAPLCNRWPGLENKSNFRNDGSPPLIPSIPQHPDWAAGVRQSDHPMRQDHPMRPMARMSFKTVSRCGFTPRGSNRCQTS